VVEENDIAKWLSAQLNDLGVHFAAERVRPPGPA
jgi:hypothetical protein